MPSENILSQALVLCKATVNSSCSGVEPWKIIAYTAVTVWTLKKASDLTQGPIPITDRIKSSLFFYLRKLPQVRRQIETQQAEVAKALEASLGVHREGEKFVTKLPENGSTHDEVMKDVKFLSDMTIDWKNGSVSGTIYHGGEELRKLSTEVYGLFCWSNPLHPDVFPGLRKMEAEVVQMCVNLYHGGNDACGTMTTGGTESILMACKAYRDRGYSQYGITNPNMVIPETAHAAFDKAGGYFGIRIIHVPVDPITGKVDLKKMKRAINSNTILLCGSAPGFPHGIIDDIVEIAKLGKSRGIGVHVDCCLGGFVLPFMKDAGCEIEPFDFSVDGVTSISCDTHKYGCAPKGTSVIMYSNKALRHHQFFSAPTWTGGFYASPSILGSRAGALVAATWAVLMYMGHKGYVDNTRRILDTLAYFREKLGQIEGLKILGDPKVCVVAFGSDVFDIYRLGVALGKKGWNLNSLQFPACIHLCVTNVHTKPGVAEKFIEDVMEATALIMLTPNEETK
eukprot:Ihof_evm8s191 gene=Ihof_evmTU8s191